MAKYKTPTIEDLLDSGVHFGHQVRRWNPKMEKYIFAQRKGIHVIDLEETEHLLKTACDFLYKTASEGGQIIFVGTKRQANDIVQLEGVRCGALYVNERWLGGTITNYKTINKNVKKFLDLSRQKEEGELEKYTKKERLLIDRKIAKLKRLIGGIVSMKGAPAALVVIDARRESTSIKEAKVAGVPVVALVDTNTDPTPVDYIIPGNDDAIRSIALVVKAFADVIELGYKDFEKNEAKAIKVAEEKRKKEAEAAEKEAAKAKKEAEATNITSSESKRSTAAVGKKQIAEATNTVKSSVTSTKSSKDSKTKAKAVAPKKTTSTVKEVKKDSKKVKK